MVYRAQNHAYVRTLLEQAGAPTKVALWALDEVPSALRAVTVGEGPGARLALLNEAVATIDVPDDAWLLLCDDDVTMDVGSLADAVRLAVLAGFDIAQPTHAWGSPHSWSVNRHRLLMWARQTRFVETGPLLMFGPRARAVCLPLDDTLGMGWGSEATWGTRWELSTGVLDGVTLRHWEPIGTGYDTAGEQAQADEVFGRLLPPAGFASLDEFQRVTARWPMWRARPPWR